MSPENTSPKASLAPYALALVVCDAIWRDPGTGKRTILGCFSTIYAAKFPATHPLLSVYTAVTDCHGKIPILLRMVDVDEERPPVFELTGEGACDDPRAVLEIDFGAPHILIPAPGEYRLQLLSGPHLLMERRILVCEVKEPRNEGD